MALTKSLQNEWTYLQRVTYGCGSHFEVIESAQVMSSRHPTVFYFLFLRAWVASTSEFQHCLLKTIMRRASQLIISAIKGICQFSLYDHDNIVSDARSDFYMYKAKCALEMELFSNIFDNADH